MSCLLHMKYRQVGRQLDHSPFPPLGPIRESYGMGKTKESIINGMFQPPKVDCWCLVKGDGLKDADSVEEDDKHGDWRDVTDEGLPSCVEGRVADLQLGFGVLGGHEPSGEEGDEDAA